ncbi:MAG: hypothetical protein RSC76_00925 [Oscillospiraceae bacterium]
MGVFVGLTKIQSLRNRIELLKIFRDFLIGLKAQISFSSFSLEEFVTGNGKNGFSTALLSALKKDGIPQAYENTARNFFTFHGDAEMAIAFLLDFGRTDLENQLFNLRRYIDLIDTKIEETSAQYREKSKVNLLFYSFIGVAVALVLI